MFDFHCHFPSQDALICTARPDETCRFKGFPYVFAGLLPQFWTTGNEALLMQMMEKTGTLVGEVGLDRRFSCSLAEDRQTEVLERILHYAADMRKPVQLHCVRETGSMVALLRRLDFPKGLFAWHGFSGSLETLSEITDLGVLFSVRPQDFLKISQYKAFKKFMFLESDYTGTNEVEYLDLLQRHYENAAGILETTPSKLEEDCRERGKAFTLGETSWN